MTLSAFDNKAATPTDADLRAALGAAYPSWQKLLAGVAERIGPTTHAWAYTTKSTGWGLRVLHKDRVIHYMTPQKDQFLVSFVLGEKAVAAAQASRLPAAIHDAIAAAPRYAEGRGVRMAIRNTRQLPGLVTLAQIKWHG